MDFWIGGRSYLRIGREWPEAFFKIMNFPTYVYVIGRFAVSSLFVGK